MNLYVNRKDGIMDKLIQEVFDLIKDEFYIDKGLEGYLTLDEFVKGREIGTIRITNKGRCEIYVDGPGYAEIHRIEDKQARLEKQIKDAENAMKKLKPFLEVDSNG